jgi:hypothetical protein
LKPPVQTGGFFLFIAVSETIELADCPLRVAAIAPVSEQSTMGTCDCG